MDITQVLSVVEKVDLFQGLMPLEELVRECPQVSLADGEVLFEYGAPGQSMYIVLAGEVQIYRNQRTIRVLGAAEYFGELALIETRTRSASVRALGPTILLEISQERFERYVRSRPEAVLAVVRRISRQLRETGEHTHAAYEHLNMVVHDMLNIATVIAAADLVKEMLPEDSEGQPLLDCILGAQGKLQTLMHNALREFRGLEVPYQKEPEHIERLLTDCVKHELSLHPDVSRARVEIHAASPLDPVPCNGLDIRRVIGNLVINAAQSAPGPVHIVVSVSQDGERTTITVADNGGGIPAELQDRVFESHFTTKASGNGIGLGSCREIVEVLHSGRLTFVSDVGRGTTFTCELPR